LSDNARMAHAFVTPRDPTRVLGRRAVAYVIDGVLFGVVGWILFSMVKHASYFGAPSDACSNVTAGTTSLCFQVGGHLYVWDRNALYRNEAITALIGFLDLVVLQALTGASIGKLCVGLRVVDGQGRRAGALRMLGRWILLLLDAGCFLVGLITVIATHPHRRVGDLMFGTFVVSRASVGQPIGSFRYSAPAFVAAAPERTTATASQAIRPPPKPSPPPPPSTSTLAADAASHWAKPSQPSVAKPAASPAQPPKKKPPSGKPRWNPAVEVTPSPKQPNPAEDD
jgi:uncharacterized RDD family membrane protein YckC